jgi:alkylated DNA nucleotide flippase Atl1
VALYLVGLNREQIADLLGYRRDAAAVGLTRALSRLPDEKELTWARPDAEFAERLVDDIRAARRPVSRGRRRSLGVAVGVIALIAAVPALAALIARDGGEAPSNGILGVLTRSCGDFTAQLNAAYARHERDQRKLMRRQARQKRAAFRALNARQRAAYEARQVREQEALLARQNRELSNLEARCKG